MPQTDKVPPPTEQESSQETDKTKTRKKEKHQEGTRDTIESILFAFVLAFLFRTFEAEAFVIPTGSMAPTLYGRHKETECTQCGHRVVVGASHEVVPETGYLMTNIRLRGAVCDNCGADNKQILDDLAFNGDRILVNKFTYEFSEPNRWDVFVFKYPAEPQTNYIKRLVGLPGESIRIRNGDLYRIEDNQQEVILRKDPAKQRMIQIPVYDDNHPAKSLIKAGWPERWENMVASDNGTIGQWSDTPEGWKRNESDRSYSITKDQQSHSHWLRYRHFFPMPKHWRAIEHNLPITPEPRLIGDFCGYNASYGDRPFDAATPEGIDFGAYWVPDLTINFQLEITDASDKSELTIELCEGTSWYRCRLNPFSGEAVLEEVNSQLNERIRELAKAPTPIKGKGTYQVAFANVDNRLCLWVNGRLIPFGEGAELQHNGATGNPFPTDQDLTPVGIAASGVSAKVSNLFLERDIYYRIGQPGKNFQHLANQLELHMNNPEAWAETYASFSRELGERTLIIPEDHFLAFGDNSPQSNDSRLWDAGHETVPRRLLVGKAFWIYWPHGVPFLNNGKGFPVTYHYQHGANDQHGTKRRPEKLINYPRYVLPIYPQFDRMRRIR